MAKVKSEIELAIVDVYAMLKNREVHPSGSFDKAGRFYAEHGELISVRSPSRAYPYSQMQACRTLKYVKAIVEHFGCTSKEEILKLI